MTENKISIYAYVISFLYVGFGTFTILCLRPDAPLAGDWTIGGIIYTLPISVLGASIVRYDPSLYPFALAVQVGMFFLFKWLVKRCLRYYTTYSPPFYLQYGKEVETRALSELALLSLQFEIYLMSIWLDTKRYYFVRVRKDFLIDSKQQLMLFPDRLSLQDFLLTNSDSDDVKEWTQAIKERSEVSFHYDLNMLKMEFKVPDYDSVADLYGAIILIRNYAAQYEVSKLNDILNNKVFDSFEEYADDYYIYDNIHEMFPDFETATFIRLCNDLHTIFYNYIEIVAKEL
jgi:hypothetical protein